MYFYSFTTKIKRMKIGILTGGGDCAGINDVIRSVTLFSERHEHELYGIQDGWLGLINYSMIPLTKMIVDDIGKEAGTILRTSRTNPFNFKVEDGSGNVKYEDKSDVVLKNFYDNKYDALIVIGGEDTQGVAQKLYEKGLPVVAIPKTMDYDLQTYSLGFDTAAAKAGKDINDLHTTAKSHSRVLVVEVLGRYGGHVALRSGIAGRADVILIPEVSAKMSTICNQVKEAYEDRKNEGLDPYAIVVLSEGAKIMMDDEDISAKEEIKKDDFGHEILSLKEIGRRVANEIEKRLVYETRSIQPSCVIRSGGSGCFDSFMGEKLGTAVLYLIEEKRFGEAVYDVQGDVIKTIPIKDLIKHKTVDVDELSLYEEMGIRFGRPPQKYKPKWNKKA